MKAFIPLVLMTGLNDTEHLVSDVPEVKSIQYFCADSLLYKKKGSKE